MRVSTVDAKNRLSELLAQAESGTEVLITRRGVPVARLVPANSFDRAAAREAAAGLLAASRGATLDGIPLRSLIEQGRD